MRHLVLIALAGALTASCSLAPTDKVLEQLATSDRTWCIAVSSVYGTLKMGGTGVANGRAICNQEGFTVDNAAVGGAIVIPAQPRILQQEPPTFRELEPPPATQRRAPAIRPQSVPAPPRPRDFLERVLLEPAGGASAPLWEVLRTSAGMHRVTP